MISPGDAATLLGISRRSVYELAAPHGPIPCTRIGKRISFEHSDVEEYKAKCRFTEIKIAVATALSSTVSLKDKGSELQSCFQKLGVAPKLTPSTAKNRPASMRPQQASNAPSTPSRMLSLVT